MLDTEDARLNRETDARTNRPVEPLPLASPDLDGLAHLRSAWSTMPMIPKLVFNRQEGIDNSWPGFDLRTLLVGEESGGRFTFHHLLLAPGAELPPHHLATADTHLVILDGEIELTIGERTETARRDCLGFAPADTTVGLKNDSAEPVSLFLWHSPAGPERAFAAAHALWRRTPDAPSEAYLEALASLGFAFHHGRERLENDRRTNAEASRLEAEVNTFQDYARLRQDWTRRPAIPKIVHDRKLAHDVPMVGQDTKILVSGDEGGGRSVIMHYGLAPGFRAEEHHQPSEEEIFLVLDGVLNLTAGNVTADVPRGGFGFVPRYGTHSFANKLPGDEVRTITINSPAGHERGFEMIVREGGSERLPDLLVAHGWRLHEHYAPKS